MNLLKKLVAFGLVAGTVSVLGLATAPVASANLDGCTGVNCINRGSQNLQTGSSTTNVDNALESIINILLFVIGAVAVIMLVIGGLRYTTSNGNAEQIKAAKNTIMYAIIGLVVAILAYAIVRWVVASLTT